MSRKTGTKKQQPCIKNIQLKIHEYHQEVTHAGFHNMVHAPYCSFGKIILHH